MSQIRSKDTKPEIKFRKYIWSKDVRGYRLHAKLKGKPDLYFSRKKIAVFINGCFWHQCPLCYRAPKTNKKFWKGKIRRNVERDLETDIYLAENHVCVLRFWEHEIKDNINSWYAKSERSTWLLGNKGNKIPDHAFFSQSHGDLSCLKSARADAHAYIQSCKSTISGLRESIGAINEKITDIKNHLTQLKREIQLLKKDRQTMFNLKKQGHNRFKLDKSIKQEKRLLLSSQMKLNALEAQKSVFIAEAKQKVGVDAVQLKIDQINKEKQHFIAQFDAEEAKNIRKQAFRNLWLRQHS